MAGGGIISNLKVRFGVDSRDFKKGLKDGESALKSFKKGAGTALEEFASLFEINMKSVNEAISTASKALNFLGSNLKAAQGGAKAFAVSLNVLKTAIVSTGIGALIVALGSLIAYFKSSGEGADRLAIIIARLKSVIDNIIDRFRIFGAGLADIFSGKFTSGWDQLKSAFAGLGAEIKEDWRLSGELAKAEDALYDAETALILTLEQRKQAVAELREEARNLDNTERERLSMIQKADSIIRTIYADQVALEKERLRIMREKLRIQNSDPTDEQLRELAVQEAKINSILAQQATELRSLSHERNTLVKIVEKQIELEQLQAEKAKNALEKVSLESIKMPDFSKTVDAVLAPLPKAKEEISEFAKQISGVVNGAFADMATGLGEFLGELFIGETGINGFGKMVAGVFADMAINVGKVAIATGLAVEGIEKALKTLKPGMAIAAGVALVALGTAVKGALASIASSGGSNPSYASSNPHSFLYDLTAQKEQVVKVEVTGKLFGEGKDLAAIIQQETNRRISVT